MKYRVGVTSFCTRLVSRNITINAKNEEEAREKAINAFWEKEEKISSSVDTGSPIVDSIEEM